MYIANIKLLQQFFACRNEWLYFCKTHFENSGRKTYPQEIQLARNIYSRKIPSANNRYE